MKHPPELLILIVPLSVVCGVAAVIGRETGSILAWCVATLVGIIIIGIISMPVIAAIYTAYVQRQVESSDETED